ncbi:MAG TPA: PKD domain-containing protein, partial [Anaerolineae bacterium]|nr:PKD domain-containing protein [Anaerolineae bacterium]HQK14686.1 PKD domain-containing protein [Anaerolineae bacterium]
EHESGAASGVVIVGQQTTVVDFGLRWQKPCLSVAPLSLEAALELGTNATLPLTLTNSGAGMATFELREQDRGFVPTVLGGPVVVTIPAGPVAAPDGTAVAGGAYMPRPERSVTIAQQFVLGATPNILLLHADDGNGEPIRSLLQAYGDLGVVDVYDARYSTPTLVELQAYDVVITWNNYAYQDATAMGNVLADYVDSGGKVVDLEFALDSSWGMQGRFVSAGYTAMTHSATLYSTACLGAFDPAHPIMDGITNVCDYYRIGSAALTPGASAVAWWSDGYLFVAAKDDRSVVSINAYVGYHSQWSGQMDAVLHNAILWLAGGGDVPWLNENPITGTVGADSEVVVDVTFDAGVPEVTQPGEYYATLNVRSDDPVQGRLGVPVTMTVLPLPSMGKVHGYVLDVCTGAPVEATIDIVGGDPISQTQSNKDTGYYSAWLYAGNYPLTFGATGYLNMTDSVTIVAGETVTLNVSMTPDRPCIAVAPDRLEAWLVYGTDVYTHPVGLDLFNKGGQDLTYEILETENILTLARPAIPPLVGDSKTAPSAYKPSLSRSQLARTYLLGGTVAVFKDVDPWGVTDVEAFLAAQGIPYEVHTSAEFATLDFDQFGMIVISSDQTQTFYDNYAAYVSKFEDYVEAGGFLNFFSADGGWNGGTFAAPLPGGMNWTRNYETYNVINDPAHPVVQGVPSPFYGSSASHGYFSNLPADAHIIASEQAGGQPTIVEYGLGAGRMIAFGQPLEIAHNWGWEAGPIMENTLLWGYSFIPVGDVPWVWEEPVSGTVVAGDGANVAVMFTALYTDSTPMPLGDYPATLLVTNNAVEGTQKVSVLMHIIGQMVTPTAAFTATTPVCIGEDAWFYFTGDKGLPFADHYTWQFGDGASVTQATADPVSHVYAAAGVYTVTLEVCNDAGCDTAGDVVQVLSLPVAGFNSTASELTVSFTNTSLHAHTYLWDFGDGVTSGEVNPVHTYTADGTYTVTLQAINDCGYDVYTATLTVYAEYTLVVTIIGNGTVDEDPNQGTYHYGDVVTLTATADPGWTFAGWSGGLTGNPTQVTILGDTVVTATFTQDEYTLTVNVVG